MSVIWPKRQLSLLVCLIALFAATGCLFRNYYDITLQNGDVVRAKTKPKLNDRGYYVYKDLTGREIEINSMRVRQIEPVRPGSEPSRRF
jgi:hypothetical protein